MCDELVRNVLLAQQPNKRFATTEELGGIAVFLTSGAAAWITGQTIAVYGGWRAHVLAKDSSSDSWE